MPQLSPIRVIRRTRLWMPGVVLVAALILLGLAAVKGHTAGQLETRGAIAEALVLGKEQRTSRDSDGNTTTTYYLSYRFTSEAGVTVERRASVARSFWTARREGATFPVRYVENRPRTHELRPGATREEADNLRRMGLAALAGAAALTAWFGTRALPLIRALIGGSRRRAVVIGHVEKPHRRPNSGGRYGRIRWRDETGVEGLSGWVPMLEVASHPVGSRITLIVDAASGRAWWDEEYGDDTVGLLQRG